MHGSRPEAEETEGLRLETDLIFAIFTHPKVPK